MGDVAEVVEFAAASPRAVGIAAEISFLTRCGVAPALLLDASERARAHGTAPTRELFALGFHRERYWSLLAADLGIDYLPHLHNATIHSDLALLSAEAVRRAPAILVRHGGRAVLVSAPRGNDAARIRGSIAAEPALAERLAIAAPEAISAAIAAHRNTALIHYAVNRLAHVQPRLSASSLGGRHGASGIKALTAAVLAIALAAPAVTVTAAGLLLTLFFVNCSVWKVVTSFGRARPMRVEPISDARLPTYTLLVPLYREAEVAPDLVAHLAALDYPIAKLQVLFLVEADDGPTRAALLRHAEGPQFEVIVVPPGGPRTKPKALTYALAFARGAYVAVFDAEDRPEADQLRKAAAAFRERPDLGCVQARLAPDNTSSWLARMFTLEYAANFEIVLPALARWDAPIPLGGTSNHFPRATLEAVGAWDPYNVTEDADLGVRLARFGHTTGTIFSRTYEEAPVTFRQWLPQRRRWIKGWIQTVALALRGGIAPGLALPLRQSLAFHGVLTAGVLGLLMYPFSLLTIGASLLAAWQGALPADPFALGLFGINAANLAIIALCAFVAALRGLAAARRMSLALNVLALPLYWALMSLAAWQALFQFHRRPFAWEKTPHGVARDRQRLGSERFL